MTVIKWGLPIIAILSISACMSSHNNKPPSKPENMMCTADVKQCSDGSFVSRNGKNGCAFKACPAQ